MFCEGFVKLSSMSQQILTLSELCFATNQYVLIFFFFSNTSRENETS